MKRRASVGSRIVSLIAYLFLLPIYFYRMVISPMLILGEEVDMTLSQKRSIGSRHVQFPYT